MSVIRTKTNMVVAYEPEDCDRYVQLLWHGPAGDGRHLKSFYGPPWPLDQYDACLQWAVSMADYMGTPLYVVPLRLKDIAKELRP